jgi:hypothetical protein
MILDRNTVFDYKTHNENFYYYLEVIILDNGEIVYAVPSHQQKLIELYCEKHNITLEKLRDIIPLYEGPLEWIVHELGVISVWYDFIYRPENITDKQKEALERLESEKCISPCYRTIIVSSNELSGHLTSKEYLYD